VFHEPVPLQTTTPVNNPSARPCKNKRPSQVSKNLIPILQPASVPLSKTKNVTKNGAATSLTQPPQLWLKVMRRIRGLVAPPPPRAIWCRQGFGL